MKKQKKTSAKAPAKPRKDPRIEQVYEEEVTFMCPVRGLVKQKVKIKKYKPATDQQNKHLIVSVSELVDQLEEKDDGLSIYSDGEELGLADPKGDSE